MPSTLSTVAWLLANRERIFRWMFLPQLLAALVFLGFAYKTGKDHCRVLLAGTRTQGTVVGFKPVLFRSSSNTYSRTVKMPIIQFRANDHVIQFQEWKAGPSGLGIGWQVPVLYDPADPSLAMMDRGAFNWFPWTPCAAIGLLLALSALKGLASLLSTRKAATPIARVSSAAVSPPP
jgi:hypothetical protein